MTTGIYLLKFIGTDKVYIGKSQNIEKRYLDHNSNLSRSASSPKLQNAYNKYGSPILEVLCTCSTEDLSFYEISYIEKYNSINNGYNTIPGSIEDCHGEDSPRATYFNETYVLVLKMLVSEEYSILDIHEKIEIPVSIIRKIASLRAHCWLKDYYPIEYAKLEEIKNSGDRRSTGVTRPTIVSPTGETYTVHNIRAFAKEHSLLESKLHNVLTGSRKTHKGWSLTTYIKRPPFPEIASPDGTTYIIEFGKVKEFARLHDLTYPSLYNVLTKKAKTHKGWKLVST